MVIAVFEMDDGTKIRCKEEMERMSRELPEQFKLELEEIWDKIYQAAIELCPKATGSLANSIYLLEGATRILGGLTGNIKTVTAGPSLSGEIVCDRTITAGDEMVINPDTLKPTSEYASLVHDGHSMRDGTFWHGVPFLTDAVAMYEDELNAAVERALQELERSK